MADINVQRGSTGTPAWVWALVGLVLLGLVLWLFMGRGGDSRANTTDDGVNVELTTPQTGTPGAGTGTNP